VKACGPDPTLGELARVVVVPFASTCSGESYYVRFLARLIADHQRHSLVAEGITSPRPSFRTLNRRLTQQLVHLPTKLRAARVELATEITIFTLAAHEGALSGEHLSKVPFDAFVEDLIAMITGMLTAPASTSRGES
jgi:hypothetical protein